MTMFDKRSRYSRTPTTEIISRDGEKRVLIELRDIPEPAATQLYVMRPGDRVDLLAYEFYRDARRYWRLADANDELDPFEIVNAGETLPVPSDT